eukprot:SAG31_NODE_14768_length_788_cov_1.593614_1_plen_226_part_01
MTCTQDWFYELTRRDHTSTQGSTCLWAVAGDAVEDGMAAIRKYAHDNTSVRVHVLSPQGYSSPDRRLNNSLPLFADIVNGGFKIPDYILVPINHPNHWAVMVIDTVTEHMEYYNSMPDPAQSKEAFATVTKWMADLQRATEAQLPQAEAIYKQGLELDEADVLLASARDNKLMNPDPAAVARARRTVADYNVTPEQRDSARLTVRLYRASKTEPHRTKMHKIHTTQ